MALSYLETRELASRYGQAVVSLTTNESALKKDIGILQNVFADQALRAVLGNPCITRSDKRALAQALCRRFKISDLMTKALATLADNGRFGLVPEFLHALCGLLDQRKGLKVGEVRSAAPLSKGEVAQLSRTLEKKLHSKVKLNSVVDRTLLAGLKINIDGIQYDSSLQSRIDKLRTSLLAMKKGA
jgi:F-type H+-transporting ATPase subunit delta